MLKFIPILVASILLASASGAHPGHSGAGQGLGLVHYLSDPLHLSWAFIVLFGGLAGALAHYRHRSLLRLRSRQRES
jgi:hypothetical protein